MNDKGLEMLRIAILKKAVDDYTKALISNNPKQTSELERFFKSEWGELLSGENSAYIIEKCRALANRKK